MTHNELLDKIYWHWKNADDSEFHGLGGYRKALRAVVDLHRPEAQEHGQYEKCWNCNLLYPCPTIQAIEEQISG